MWVSPATSDPFGLPSACWEMDDGRHGRTARRVTLTAAMRDAFVDCPAREAVQLMVSTVFAKSPTLLLEALAEVCGVYATGAVADVG